MSFAEFSRSSEEEFLRRLQRGDNDAWAELTQSYMPRLYKYLQHNLPSQADAEDALGETMLAAVRAIPNFDGRVPLSAFLFSLAYRKVADFWRSRKDLSQLGEQVAAPRKAETARAEFEELLNELPGSFSSGSGASVCCRVERVRDCGGYRSFVQGYRVSA